MNPNARLDLIPALANRKALRQLPPPTLAFFEEESEFPAEHDFLVQNLRPDLLEDTEWNPAPFAIDLP